MMSVVNFIRLQAFEFGFLAVLVILPYFFALRSVGLTLVIVGLTYGGYRMLHRRMVSRVPVVGRAVFITGCDTGIGHSFARRMASLGFKVFAGCYVPDGEGANTLKARGGDNIHIVALDISKDESVTQALNTVKRNLQEKCLWAIVNNAGQDYIGDVELSTMDIYKRLMDVNMFGMVRVSKAFLPLIRQSKGRVLNVTSAKGRIAVPKTAAYSMTKYAGEAFSDALRREMRKWGVKVSIIEPCNFGGTTNIVKNENLSRIKTELDIMWETATPEVKEAYGKEYNYKATDTIVALAINPPSSLAPVVDAMEDAVMNSYPRARYLIGGSTHLFDIYKVALFVNQYLPEWLSDAFVERNFWADYPLPQAINNQP